MAGKPRSAQTTLDQALAIRQERLDKAKDQAKRAQELREQRKAHDGLILRLDAAANTRGQFARSAALRQVHEAMMAAKLPKTSWLWRKLDDAYNA